MATTHNELKTLSDIERIRREVKQELEQSEHWKAQQRHWDWQKYYWGLVLVLSLLAISLSLAAILLPK